jgi:hypothetical protein
MYIGGKKGDIVRVICRFGENDCWKFVDSCGRCPINPTGAITIVDSIDNATRAERTRIRLKYPCGCYCPFVFFRSEIELVDNELVKELIT